MNEVRLQTDSMADVFVSYSRVDHSRIEQLVAALEEEGYSVWWDRQIEGGRHFAKDIEREITAAKAVIAAWSVNAVESHWVLDEASYARDEGKLLPITLDSTQAPLGYRQIQSIDFSSWPKNNKPVQDLFRALTLLSGNDTGKGIVEAKEPPKSLGKGLPKRTVIASLAAIGLALAGMVYSGTSSFSGYTELEDPGAVSIAILPFTVAGDVDESERQFGPGLAAAINANLSQLPGVALSSSSSGAQLLGQSLTVAQIGERLNVEHIVEGQLRFEGEDAVLTVSLVNVETFRQIWSDSFRASNGNMAALSYLATNQLASALQSRFGVGQSRLPDNSNVDRQAYEAYLRGIQYLFGRQIGDNRRKALMEISESIRLDPDFAPSHAALGFLASSSAEPINSRTAQEAEAVSRQATDRALALDPNNIMAKVVKQMLILNYGGNVDDAIAKLRDIVAEHPDYALGQFAIGLALAQVGEHELALQHYRKAMRIDPIDSTFRIFHSVSLLAEGNYSEIRRLAMDCVDCVAETPWWGRGLVWLASDQQFATDIVRLEERFGAMGLPPEQVNRLVSSISAARGMQPLPANWEDGGLVDSDILMGLVGAGEFERALVWLDQYPLVRPTAGTFILLLDTPGMEWPKEVRADPRYHAFFNEPGPKGLIAERRKRDQLRNLPAFPLKPYNAI